MAGTAWRKRSVHMEHRSRIRDVSVTHDGGLLASVGEDGLLVVRNERDNALRKITVGEKAYCVEFSPGGALLAAGGARRIDLFSRHGEHEAWLAQSWVQESIVRGIDFFCDARRLAAGSSDGTVRIWDVERATSLQTLTVEGQCTWMVRMLSPRSMSLVSCNASPLPSGELRVWDLRRGGAACVRIMAHREAGVYSLALTSDEHLCVCGLSSGDICAYDTRTWTLLHRYHLDPGVVYTCDFSPEPQNSRLLALGTHSNRVVLFDVERGNTVADLESHHAQRIEAPEESDSVLCVKFVGAAGDKVRPVITWSLASTHVA